jgi:hypothetical protein
VDFLTNVRLKIGRDWEWKMIVFEFKAKGTKQQYQKIDEAIRSY